MKVILTPLSGIETGFLSDYEVVAGQSLKLGRDKEQCPVNFADSTVSRLHATLELDPKDPAHLLLRHLGNTNKTYVNGEEVVEVRLQPGDKIRLGKNGPYFAVDMVPRPPTVTMFDKTSAEQIASKVILQQQTSADSPPSQISRGRDAGGMTKHQAPPSSSSQKAQGSASPFPFWWIAAIAGVGVIAIGGAVLLNRKPPPPTPPPPPREKSWSEIIETARGSVVHIRTSWRLVDPQGPDDASFHLQTRGGLPAFFRNREGEVFPILLRSQVGAIKIGGETQGSGFIVGDGKHALTCAHVVEPQRNIFLNSGARANGDDVNIMVYDFLTKSWSEDVISARSPAWNVTAYPRIDSLEQLARGSVVLKKGSKAAPTPKGFVAKYAYQEVYFDGDASPHQYTLAEVDSQQNAAVIEIKGMKNRPVLNLSDYNEAMAGREVGYLGFPSSREKIIKKLSDGTLSEIPKALALRSEVMSDGKGQGSTSGSIEFKVPFAGVDRGSCGSPVFDIKDKGKVVGILISTALTGGTDPTYVLPIEFGRRLIK